jgi:aspartyl-tRNA(Asn)/glutamyl-tRNA(Gln) amidotransferase subunit B
MQWETVIGLEIHAQLATRSKIFSGASTAYGAEPNTQACAVDLGLPGVLPVVNEQAIAMAVRFGLAIDASITPRSVFARKNYFYPDLPKGYQISQYEAPIVALGKISIEVEGQSKTINITRAHLEEDAGKSLHEDFHGASGIDLNRAGTPLLEIVSEPEMRSAAEAAAYMREIHRLVRYLGICDGNMQEGSFRCDANVSVRPLGSATFGTRAEIKNLNSFRFIERAIEFEVERQIELIENGGKVVQETRLYDPDKDETRPLRSKEDAHDYRYFPDPDLLPVAVSAAYIDVIRATMPELPRAKLARFVKTLELSHDDASVLVNDPDTALYFERAIAAQTSAAKQTANWITGELFAALNRDSLSISACPIRPEQLGQLVQRILDGTLSGKLGKQVFQTMWSSGRDADDIIEAEGMRQVSDTHLIEVAVREVLEQNPDQIAQLRAGKDKVLGFLVGQVMKKTGGKANPALVNQLIKSTLAT